MILPLDVTIIPYEIELKFERAILTDYAFKMKFWGEMGRLISRLIEEELEEKPDAVRVEEPKR